MQRLQFFLSESPGEAELVNERRLELLREEPAKVPPDGGAIGLDDYDLDTLDGVSAQLAHTTRTPASSNSSST